MERLIPTSLTLVWGAWFGGLIILFVAVQSIFKTFAADHATAGMVASGIFQKFNSIQLGLAAAAVLLTFFWWIIQRSKTKTAIFTLFGLATTSAVYITAFLTPKIEELRKLGLTQTPDFRRLHGLSMTVYLAETLLILAAGIALAQIRKLPND